MSGVIRSFYIYMWTLFNIFIILEAIIFLPLGKNPFWLPKNLLFTLFGLIYIGLSYIYPRKRNFNNIWLGLIFVYIMLHFSWFFLKPIVLSNIIGKVIWNVWSFLPTINFIIAILLIQVLVESIDNLRRWLNLANVLCWLSFIFSIYAIIQFLGIDQIFQSNLYWLNARVAEHYKGEYFQSYRMITFFGNKMQTATFLGCLSPFCLMFKDLKYKFFYLFIGIAILLTQSYLGIFVFISGLLSYLIFTKRFRLAFLGIIFCGLFSFMFYKINPSFFNLYGRFDIYKKVFIDSCGTFFTGSGIGSFPILNYSKDELWIRDLGFEPLQLLREGGIILIGLVIMYLINLAQKVIKAEKNMLLIGYSVSFIVFLIASLGGYTFHLAPLSLIGILEISSLEAQLIKE